MDGLPPGDPRRCATASRRAGSARRAWCTPRSGSSSTGRPPTGCSTPAWAAGRCWTWASTRSPSPTWCSARPTRAARRRRRSTTTGIDTDIAIAGRHAGGAVSALTATMRRTRAVTATIATDTGRVDLARRVLQPAARHVGPARRRARGDPGRRAAARQRARQRGGRGAALPGRAGLRESPLVPHEQTLRILRQMDDLRRQVGLVYPGERALEPVPVPCDDDRRADPDRRRRRRARARRRGRRWSPAARPRRRHRLGAQARGPVPRRGVRAAARPRRHRSRRPDRIDLRRLGRGARAAARRRRRGRRRRPGAVGRRPTRAGRTGWPRR